MNYTELQRLTNPENAWFEVGQFMPTFIEAESFVDAERMRARCEWLSLFMSVLATIIFLAGVSFGQTQALGTISGTIVDPSGGLVPGAKITATNKATGQTTPSVTNSVGRYVLSNLPTGTYDVAAEVQGFQRCVNTGVGLDPAASVQLTCGMKVGSVTERVEVQAQALNVQTEDSKVSRVVNDTQIQEIPLNGRNFASLLGLQPGITQEFAFNSFQGAGVFATEGTHVNGLRGDSNNVQIEGSPSTRTRANGAVVAPPSVDAISEVNIVTTGYLPEYARAGGGQIIVQMKSGGEQYHGSVYEFLRNDALDARNYFARPPSPKSVLKYNNFGYSFGGPVIPHKKKLFFFWSQEWYRIAQSYTNTATVPTTLARQGNFSEYCAAGLACPTVPAYLNGVNGLVAGQPFPNNTVPQNLFSPNGTAFVNLMAVPNELGLASNNVQQVPDPNFNRAESIKVDSQFDSIKSHLSVALRHFRSDNFDAGVFSGAAPKLINWNIQLPERGGTIDLTTTFSPTLLNDFSFTATEDIVHVRLPDGPGLNRTALGINYPYIFGDASKDLPGKTPTIAISGFDQINQFSDAYPSGSTGHVWQWQDVLTKTRGAHLIKTGVWIEKDGEDDYDQLQIGGDNLNGTFTFNGQLSQNAATTGAPLADALLGNYDDYRELGFRNRTPWVAMQYGLFAQDTWKATPRLTLSGGLRWDYYAPYHSKWCNFSTFDPLFYSRRPGEQQVVNPTTGLVEGGNPYNGIAAPCNQLPRSAIGHFGVFGQPLTAATYDSINQQLHDTGIMRGLTPEIFNKHYGNIQPRFGFAWDPFGKGTTSIRASGGMFYSHITLSDATLLGKNVPFQTASESNGGKVDCPGFQVGANRTCVGSGPTTGIPLPIPISGGDLDSPIPVVYQWSANVQHMFPQDTLVEVGYVGTRGRHFEVNADFNQLALGVLAAARASNPNITVPAIVPYTGFGQALVGLQNGNSTYNSLQVSAQHRMHRGLQFGLAYTYSHAYDYGSDRNARAIDTYDLGLNYGPADWQRNHVLVANYVYELPFLKGSSSFIGKALGGWEVAGVVGISSGHPYSITDSGADTAGVGEDFNQPAQLVPGCDPNSGPHNVNQWFKASCFTLPAPGTFGNAGRNRVWGPGSKNWDFALYKNGPFTEKLHYQFRAEFFNVLNHPTFSGGGAIDTGVTDSNFGQVTSATDPRQIQFGLKLLF